MDLQYLLLLQQLRTALGPGVESFFNLITAIPASAGIILLPAAIYWCIDKRSGQFILFNFAGGMVVNQAIKNTACVYRPWIRDPSIVPSAKAKPGATGYSFPSGHTQSTTSLFGGLAVRFKGRILHAACVIFIILIGFSRNFLGCHTPQDVAVALLEGVCILFLSSGLFRYVDEHPSCRNALLLAGLVIDVLFLIYITRKPYPMTYVDGILLVDPVEMQHDCYSAAGVFGGYLAGTFLEEKYVQFDTDCSRREKCLRLIIGLLLVGAFYAASGVLKGRFDMRFVKLIRTCVTAILAVVGVPALFGRIKVISGSG